MLIDDKMTNLKTGKIALAEKYEVYTALSAKKLFELLSEKLPSLILLDVDMPDMNGYEAIEVLKADPRTADIPVIFLTGKSDADSEIMGLKLGAADYISKPFLPELLRIRVELHLTVARQRKKLERQGEELKKFNEDLKSLVESKTMDVLQLQGAILHTVADLVESRDTETGGHIDRAQRWLELMIDGMEEAGVYTDEIKTWDKKLVLQSSQLHDVGKISIQDSILQKQGKLTDEEFTIMMKHTVYGAEIIARMMNLVKDNVFLNYAKVFAETHQEKWDGSGYPYGLKGDEIPLLGRVMAIADVYDALTSVRPYKPAFGHEKAVQIICDGRGEHFDPALVDVFLNVQEQIAEERKKFAAERGTANVENYYCKYERV